MNATITNGNLKECNMTENFTDQIRFMWVTPAGMGWGKSPTAEEARIITALSVQPPMSKLVLEANGLAQQAFWFAPDLT
ncbi:hypothetical protein [Mycobacteroides abscessus]|uniref:hypothetical protein n=1 Tax=Mycobacteroides abscessus TaxID=36809 RepID=UPI001877B4D5|nr:hypothetical protein [Mycobacteroides abscessus]